jgi:hypothetical protein
VNEIKRLCAWQRIYMQRRKRGGWVDKRGVVAYKALGGQAKLMYI